MSSSTIASRIFVLVMLRNNSVYDVVNDITDLSFKFMPPHFWDPRDALVLLVLFGYTRSMEIAEDEF